MKQKGLRHCILIGLLTLVIAIPAQVFAQDLAPDFRQEELDQMLAPIALYPDSLLAQILMAATYPLEIVLADRWIKENSNLQGDALNDALDLQNWDPSVKALVPFPNILSMMSEELDWTQRVGEAFLAQETTVMDTIQQLRSRAYIAGTLASNEQLLVSREDNIITIEPYNPRVVYVPVYDPWEVYGPWWWPHYPPYIVYRYPSNVVVAPGIIWFGTSFSVGSFWNHGWGYWDWGHRRCYVNVNRTVNINRNIIINRGEIRTTPWKHNIKHRRGVAYRVPATREKFMSTNRRTVDYSRNYRGYEQSKPAGQTSSVSRPAPRTRSSKKITWSSPKTRSRYTEIARSTPKIVSAIGDSRPSPKTGTSKKITRPTSKTRPGSAATVKRSLPNVGSAHGISKPTPNRAPRKNITRSAPKTRSGSSANVKRSLPKTKSERDISRPTPNTTPRKNNTGANHKKGSARAKRSAPSDGRPTLLENRGNSSN